MELFIILIGTAWFVYICVLMHRVGQIRDSIMAVNERQKANDDSAAKTAKHIMKLSTPVLPAGVCSCPACGGYILIEGREGQSIQCPKCGAEITLPE